MRVLPRCAVPVAAYFDAGAAAGAAEAVFDCFLAAFAFFLSATALSALASAAGVMAWPALAG